MVILRYLILLSIILLPTSMILRFEPGGGFVLNFIDAFVFLTSIVGLALLTKSKDLEFAYKKQALALFGIFIFSMVINLPNLNYSQAAIAFLYTVRFFSYFFIYVIISKQDEKFKKNALNLLLFSGFIFAVIGFVQFIFYPYLRNIEYLGWDVHLYRLVSSFLDPNFAGIYFALNSFLITSLIISSKDKKPLLLIFLLILTLTSLILTYSRTAYLMFATGIVILFVLNSKAKIVPYIIILSLITVAVLFFTTRSEGTNLLRTTSTFARGESYIEGFRIFSDHPIFGVGFNAYRFAAEKYNFSKGGNKDFPDHGKSSNDNSLLFILATTGIIGFLIFVYFWTAILRGVLKSKDPMSKVLVASLISLFFASFFVNALFFPTILFFLWVILGIKVNSSV